MRRGVGAPLPEAEFDGLARAAFAYQCAHNEAYARFARGRGASPDAWPGWSRVPPVPTMAFKELVLVSSPGSVVEAVFRTSGTTRGSGRRGEHHVRDVGLYREAALTNFAAHLLPDGARPLMLSLVPSPEAAPDSSLSRMVGFVAEDLADESRYAVDVAGTLDRAAIDGAVAEARRAGRPLLVVGTAFAFVHWLDALERASRRHELPEGSRIMETGGFKGRSRSVAREELYTSMRERLGIPPARVVNEYGMTELLSQFYEPVLLGGPRVHRPPPWVRTRVVDPVTLDPVEPGREGLLCHFDLANLGSVCSVLTEDIGTVPVDAPPGAFRVVGRASDAEPRGCSIAMDELLSAAGGGG